MIWFEINDYVRLKTTFFYYTYLMIAGWAAALANQVPTFVLLVCFWMALFALFYLFLKLLVCQFLMFFGGRFLIHFIVASRFFYKQNIDNTLSFFWTNILIYNFYSKCRLCLTWTRQPQSMMSCWLIFLDFSGVRLLQGAFITPDCSTARLKQVAFESRLQLRTKRF